MVAEDDLPAASILKSKEVYYTIKIRKTLVKFSGSHSSAA